MDKVIHRIGAGYGDDIVVFHLRSISIAEENAYTNRFLDIGVNESVEGRAKKEHDIFVDSLASWSDIGPTSVNHVNDSVEFPQLYPDAETPADAVKLYFKDCGIERSRIALQVVGSFRQRLQPKVVFY